MKTSCLAKPSKLDSLSRGRLSGHVVKNNWAALSQGSPIALV